MLCFTYCPAQKKNWNQFQKASNDNHLLGMRNIITLKKKPKIGKKIPYFGPVYIIEILDGKAFPTATCSRRVWVDKLKSFAV